MTAHSSAGRTLGSVQPQLAELADRVLGETSAAALRGHDVVFLALPHGQSAAYARESDPDTLIVDCGADFRLRDPAAWERFYGSAHAGTWPYGLPELPGAREALKGATRIAVPGCYPTAVTLALFPAHAAGSWSRRSWSSRPAGPRAPDGPQAAPPRRRGDGLHEPVRGRRRPPAHPELVQNLSGAAGEHVTVSFTPTLAPMPRGILATCSARLRPEALAAGPRSGARGVRVRLRRRAVRPAAAARAVASTAAVLGSNTVQVQIAVDPDASRLICVSAVDNLTKGTAGGAVQSMNVALGLPERLGLPRMESLRECDRCTGIPRLRRRRRHQGVR